MRYEFKVIGMTATEIVVKAQEEADRFFGAPAHIRSIVAEADQADVSTPAQLGLIVGAVRADVVASDRAAPEIAMERAGRKPWWAQPVTRERI